MLRSGHLCLELWLASLSCLKTNLYLKKSTLWRLLTPLVISRPLPSWFSLGKRSEIPWPKSPTRAHIWSSRCISCRHIILDKLGLWSLPDCRRKLKTTYSSICKHRIWVLPKRSANCFCLSLYRVYCILRSQLFHQYNLSGLFYFIFGFTPTKWILVIHHTW